MENTILTAQDYNDILESLQFTLDAKEGEAKYPNYEYKVKTIADTHALIAKVKKLKKQL